MSKQVKQFFLVFSLLAYLIFAFVAGGLLTNWFRYGPSLEALVTLVPLVLVSIGIVVLHFMALLDERRSSTTTAWAFVSAVAGVLMTLLLNNSASGQYWPEWYKDHVEQNAPQQLVMNTGQLSYHLELHNPFATFEHEEYLVVSFDKTVKQIRLTLFDHSLGGILSPAQAPRLVYFGRH